MCMHAAVLTFSKLVATPHLESLEIAFKPPPPAIPIVEIHTLSPNLSFNSPTAYVGALPVETQSLIIIKAVFP